MKTPHEFASRFARVRAGRRLAVVGLLGALVFLTLWLTVCSAMTSIAVAVACSALITASAASDPIEMVLDAIGVAISAIAGVFSLILSAILSLLDW